MYFSTAIGFFTLLTIAMLVIGNLWATYRMFSKALVHTDAMFKKSLEHAEAMFKKSLEHAEKCGCCGQKTSPPEPDDGQSVVDIAGDVVQTVAKLIK